MDESEPSSFGALLRQLRTEAGLTQAELAERAGLSGDAIGTLERGARRRPHRDTVRLLADALQLGSRDRSLFETAAQGTPPVAVDGHDRHAPPDGSFLGAMPAGVLVGRAEETARIDALLDAVMDGSGQLLLLAGERGIGKTRLAQEAMARARARGFLAGAGQCYREEEHIPYRPLLEALAGCAEGAPAGQRASIDREWQTLRQRIDSLLAVGPSPGGIPELARLVTGFVLGVATSAPLALLVDDLHWADEGTLALLHSLACATRGSRIFLVGTFRDERLSEEYPALARTLKDLSRERLTERIAVRRLSAEETATLAASLMGQETISEDIAAFISRRTKGIPRLVDQMVRSLGGRLELQAEIGAGAMGRVFRAYDTRTQQVVAAKIMLGRGELDLDALLRFEHEASVLTTLDHPHIVRIHDSFVEEHACCIIMELLEGQALGTILRDGPLPLSRARELALQVADALSYAHAHAIAHRDIKPDNVMILEGDRVKVTDFGIARILQRDTSLQTFATTGMRMGTPLYMAPEQVEGERIDGRTDVYALGAVLYHMVTGRPPLEGSDPLAVALKQVREEPAPPSTIDPSLPEDWDMVILKALAKDPADRFQSAKEMGEAIAGLSLTEPPTAEDTSAVASRRGVLPRVERSEGDPLRPPSLDRHVARHGKKRAGWFGAASVGLAALVIAGALFLNRPGASHSQSGVTSRLVASWQLFAGPSQPLASPSALTVAGNGVVYALDRSAGRIFRISPNGRVLGSWGTSGIHLGQLRDPGGLALDHRGNVYVADTGNDRIEKFSARGRFLAAFGKRGVGFGQFRSPKGVAVGRNGTIYVADARNDRVEALTPAGAPVPNWDPLGSQSTRFSSPASVAVLSGGRVLILDPAARQADILNPDGAWFDYWNAGFAKPIAATVDAQNHVYVLDTGLDMVLAWDADAQHLLWKVHRALRSVRGLAVAPSGDVYVADPGHHRILKLKSDGKVRVFWKGAWDAGRPVASPVGLTRDARGDLYVTDTAENQVLALSPTGEVLRRWRGGGSAGPLGQPSGVAIDSRGRLYVVDTAGDHVLEFSPSGAVEATWGTTGSDPGQFYQPHGVAVDPQGNVYVTDTGNSRIEEFTRTRKLLGMRSLVEAPTNPRDRTFLAPQPYGIATDARGYIYVTDTWNDVIVKLSPDGLTVKQWGGTGSGPGRLLAPEGIAVSPSGTIYVADTGNHRVELFTSSGKLLGIIRQRLDAPADVLVTPGTQSTETLYVADSGNGRVDRFTVPLPGHQSAVPAATATCIPAFVDFFGNYISDPAYSGFVRAASTLRVRKPLVYDASQVADTYTELSRVARRKPCVAVLFGLDDAGVLTTISARYPKVHFALIDNTTYNNNGPVTLPNVEEVTIPSEQVGYLVGYLAGLMEKKKVGKAVHGVIGVMGGVKVPQVDSFMDGYRQGAHAAYPGITVLADYAGSFTDQRRGLAIGLRHISRGADILFGAAGETSLGYLRAAKEHGLYAIGVDQDQSYLGPYVLTSALKNYDTVVYSAVMQAARGKFKGGEQPIGLAGGGVAMAKPSALVPASIVAAVQAQERKIISGQVTVQP
jgi:serine/threonine protein kinase/basic membrane lipoprotein Med (substrate-binding protein (PBP1-ABC) superfamily)/DNA-binding beta-propeller fold protein YncE/transcriptional regulator with XRE-family HTH domain